MTSRPSTGSSKEEVSEEARGQVFTGLRVVRTVAMLSIVAYHVLWSPDQEPDPIFGVAFGLSTLQVVMCALIARRSTAPTPRDFVPRRAARLLLPWIFWSVVYIAVKVLLALRYGHAWWSPFEWSMVIAGGSFHLWFLSYGFVASLVVLFATRACEGNRARMAIPVAGVAGTALVLLGTVLTRALPLPDPLPLWIDGSAAVAFGLAIGRALSLEGRSERRTWLLIISGMALLPLLVGPSLAPHSQLWARYGVAVPLACLGFSVRVPESRLLTFLASYNMGVYVVHILAIQLVNRLPLLAGLPDAGRIMAVYGICLVLVACLRRTRLSRVA